MVKERRRWRKDDGGRFFEEVRRRYRAVLYVRSTRSSDEWANAVHRADERRRLQPRITSRAAPKETEREVDGRRSPKKHQNRATSDRRQARRPGRVGARLIKSPCAGPGQFAPSLAKRPFPERSSARWGPWGQVPRGQRSLSGGVPAAKATRVLLWVARLPFHFMDLRCRWPCRHSSGVVAPSI